MTNGDDTAFPEIETKRVNGSQHYGRESYYGDVSSVGGLTKREYFAAMALQGILANGNYGDSWEREAISSVEVADALIAALNEDPK